MELTRVKTTTLNEGYREQWEEYSSISQEEVELLYASEDITGVTYNDKMIELKNKKSRLVGFDSEEKLLAAIFGIKNEYVDYSIEQLQDLKLYIDGLISDMKYEIEVIKNEANDVYDYSSYSNKQYDDLMDKLNDFKSGLSSEQKKAEEIEQALSKKEKQKLLIEINEQINELERTYKDRIAILYTLASGGRERTRKYPSFDLRNKIALGHVNLAKKLAKMYYYKSIFSRSENPSKVELMYSEDDLFQIAFMSIMSAAYYYVPGGTAKFSTYARKCAENKLKRELWPKKKRTPKQKDFFDTEEDMTDYMLMYLNAHVWEARQGAALNRSTYGKYITRSMNDDIGSHNRDMLNKGQQSRLIPKLKDKKEKKVWEFQRVLDELKKWLKSGNVSLLITDEDRIFISRVLAYEGRGAYSQDYYALIKYIELYKERLDTISEYLEIEADLTKRNNGITPSTEDIVLEYNVRRKQKNKQIKELKKEDFFKRRSPSYNWAYNYYELYMMLNNVDLLKDSKYPKRRKDISVSGLECDYDIQLRYYEIIINSKYEYVKLDIGRSYQYDSMVCREAIPYPASLYNRLEDKTNCYLKKEALEMLSKIITDMEEEKQYASMYANRIVDDTLDPDDYPTNCEDETIGRKEEKAEITSWYYKLLDAGYDIGTLEEFMEAELKERAKRVNEVLKARNAPIYKTNTGIADLKKLYDHGSKYYPMIDSKEVKGIEQLVNVLYSDNQDTMDLLINGRVRRRHQKDLPVQDEAESNIFMEEYYKALEDLPETEASVLRMYFDRSGVHSHTAKEIAEYLGLRQSQVYYRKDRGLRLLREKSNLGLFLDE